MPNLVIEGSDVRIDKETAFVCITDIANLKRGGKENIKSWLKLTSSIEFFTAWEKRHNHTFEGDEFKYLRDESGSNTFHLSASELIKAGATGIFVRRGRYGGTFCAPQWAIHFANWLDADFYLQTVNEYIRFSELHYGEYAQLKRYSRELAAETFSLTSGSVLELPGSADPLFKKRIGSIEADILNLAMWGMTAQEWRIKYSEGDNRKNMRDHATPEELKALAILQALSQEMYENAYTNEERLDRLSMKADELIGKFCNSQDKRDTLTLAQEKRGWGRFIL